MILPPFQGPRLKIRRARKHIADLRDMLREFGARVKINAYLTEETENHKHYRLGFSELPPEEVPVIIGDAIHNLRAALDIMICDIARLRGKSSDQLKFPFAATPEDLEKIIAKGLRRLGDDVVQAVRALDPYKGGNIALRGLHDLDIDDKHETVLPYYLVANSRMNVQWQGQNAFDMMAQMLGMNGMVMPIREGHFMALRKDLDPFAGLEFFPEGPQPCFPEGLPFAGHSIFEILEGLADIIDQIVEAFAAQFGGGDAEPPAAPIGNDHPVERG